uniref:Anillin n=1 Tax=Nothobranchius kuhntae TaxID=321403 RepID=A0A1A8J998_NOTKU
MDPFTEKLLERTRARRENLQKKLAERPNAASRLMVKRSREPLTDTNSVISGDAANVPQVSSKPSPSKRRCSEENAQPSADENQEPAVAPLPLDPPTDKKPPVGPTSTRLSSCSERTCTPPVVQCQQTAAQSEPEKMIIHPDPDPPNIRETPAGSGQQKEEVDALVSGAAGMKSRFQRLAEQRKCWDGEGAANVVPDCMSMLRRQADVQPPPPALSSSSEAPVGRRGRLANLAATIGSWEDDLSHASVPRANLSTRPSPRLAAKVTSVASSIEVTSSAASSKSSTNQEVLHPPIKPGRVGLPSSQKAPIPASRPGLEPGSGPGPQKTSVPPSPLKNQALPRNPNPTPTTPKPGLGGKPTISSSVVHQEKAGDVKSFLERFGERCQERNTPSKNPPGTPSVTPNTKLVQERLRAAQAASTTTAELAQRHRWERESELAQIRSRCQKGANVWKTPAEETRTRTDAGNEEKVVKPVERDAAAPEPQSGPSAAPDQPEPPCEKSPPASAASGGPTRIFTPPASTSSPLKAGGHVVEKLTDETPEEEKEQNVDQSINSAVISELFDGVLEQSDEDEEEDALNISSMSILTPLAETVAAVVKSPERGMMTSTPASSFMVKNAPENISKPGKFQRAAVRTSSSSNSDGTDEDSRLPYSIDAYRSVRVKEADRPSVKQVIVRKEDVSERAEEPRGASAFSIKQRMKILANEINLQQTVIHQASQALNCCTDEEHGKGSQVEAEAERLLLVATEKREALSAELDRLRANPAAQRRPPPAATEPAAVSASKGSISLQDLRLPLKADFVCSTANKPESTKHSFFILIRAGPENLVATPLASTHRGLNGDTLAFPTSFSLSDVSSDFKIQLEVYALVQKRESCSDKKKKPSKSKAITPKRFLAITKSAQTPVVASPGGLHAVRTSNFVLVGSHALTLSSIGKGKFPLDKVPFLCPLEGHIHLKMHCEVGSKVEERGFLTMFEDVSGFGAWHRRWCVLSGYCVSYWTYPDDEKRKSPIGRLSLTNCTSKKVEPANREFCARPNTFELITVRPQQKDDRETLVSQCLNTMCVTKNWLSADTKEERNLWMRKLNQILVDLRMWQPDACYQPL